MDKNSIYQQKYLKYKSKYTELKNNGLKGGSIPKIINKGRYMRNLKGGAEINLSDAIPSITSASFTSTTELNADIAGIKGKEVTESCELLHNKLKALAIRKGININFVIVMLIKILQVHRNYLTTLYI